MERTVKRIRDSLGEAAVILRDPVQLKLRSGQKVDVKVEVQNMSDNFGNKVHEAYQAVDIRLYELHSWVQPDAPAVHPCPDTDAARRAKRVRYEIEADESTLWYELRNEGKELLARIRGMCFEAVASRPRDPDGIQSLIRVVVQAEIESRIKADGDLLLDHAYLKEIHRFDPSFEVVVAALVALASSAEGAPPGEHGRLAFPWKRFYLEKHVGQLFANLKGYRDKIDPSQYGIKDFRPLSGYHQIDRQTTEGDFLQTAFRDPGQVERAHRAHQSGRRVDNRDCGTYIVARADRDEYIQMDIIADCFTEKARLRARRKDQTQSPFEMWGDEAFLRKVYRMAVDAAADRSMGCALDPNLGQLGLDAYIVRECVFKSKVKECTQFKPSLAKFVIEKLRGSRVLDFSAGWGDRLVGAAAAKTVLSYQAFDPNTDLIPGHTAIIERLVDEPRRKNFSVIYEPAQHVELPYGRTYDLIFTSPPFFDLEIYTDKAGQSVLDFTTRDQWLVGFLFVCFRKFWKVLEFGGHMAIHMSDDWNHNGANGIVEPMSLFAQARLPCCIYNGIIGSVGAAGKPRPIWVFQKVAKASESVRANAARAEALLEQHFPNVYREMRDRDWLRDEPAAAPHVPIAAVVAELNKPIVVSQHFSTATSGVRVNVIRDDYLVGGSKQRALDVFMHEGADEYVYAGPVQGYAQVALAHVCKIHGKKATVVLGKNRDGSKHRFTQKAEELGANVIFLDDSRLKNVQAEAQSYVNRQGRRTVMLPFGLHSDEFITTLAARIRAALPADSAIATNAPKRMWLVAGSATLLAAFHTLWPSTHFLVVQVGKQVYSDQLEGIDCKLYKAPERFAEDARVLPPYNSVRNYDAKLWQFVQREAEEGDWVWNVGGD